MDVPCALRDRGLVLVGLGLARGAGGGVGVGASCAEGGRGLGHDGSARSATDADRNTWARWGRGLGELAVAPGLVGWAGGPPPYGADRPVPAGAGGLCCLGDGDGARGQGAV